MPAMHRATSDLTAPPENGVAVTPSDTDEVAFITRAIWVGTGGDVSVLMAGGNTLVISNVQDGTLLPLRTARVNATGTTASDIVAFW